MALLRAVVGLEPGQVFALEGESTILGRSPDCDIVLDVGAVSRQHARVSYVDGGYYIEDLNSRNGTYLNDRLVSGRQRLADNDRVRICDLVFAFRAGPGEADPIEGGTVTLEQREAMLVDDGRSTTGSTVMSKLDASAGQTGARLRLQPEAKLKALVEIGQSLGRALAPAEVLPRILDGLFSIFPQADRGFIVLRAPDSGRLVPMALKHRRDSEADTIRLSRTIVNEVMHRREAILSADATTDARFDMAESIVDFHIRSMMCAPLVGTNGEALGVIQIDTLDQHSRFSKEDLDVLVSVAGQAAFAVENAQLHEAALRERALAHELAIAHEVQQGFLPDGHPAIPGYGFFDFYEPANQLGGDYYDYVWLGDGRWAVVLADVSGKGISAALLMARLSAEVRYNLASQASLPEAVREINRVLCQNRWEDRFITMILGVLDPRSHRVSFVNAGHMPPLLHGQRATCEAVTHAQTGLPLGVDRDVTYVETTVPLRPGDSLTLYSDGITEAMNDAGDLYGRSRLWARVDGVDEPDVAVLGRTILDDVKRFVGNRPQSDDMCMTCFGRLA
ncbi:MAG: SpoIIE family protein phosphatase [Pirellulales bacterium]|nr:SpoIIE family protein phosphatase [Pirellulales bacterium]